MDRFHVKYFIAVIFFQSVILFNSPTSAYAQTDSIIRIKLSGSVYSDETVIRIKEGTTTSFDFDYDAYKIMSGRTTPSMYTYIGTTNYSINSIPAKDSLRTILLGTKIKENGTYIISFENSTGLHDYILIDKKLGEKIPVDSSVIYSFTGSVNDAVNRFELQLQVPDNNIISTVYKEEEPVKPSMPTLVAEPIVDVTSCSGGIHVSLKDVSASMYQIEIVGMGGRVLKTITKSIGDTGSSNDFIEVNDLTAGNYLVKLIYDNIVTSYQVVII